MAAKIWPIQKKLNVAKVAPHFFHHVLPTGAICVKNYHTSFIFNCNVSGPGVQRSARSMLSRFIQCLSVLRADISKSDNL